MNTTIDITEIKKWEDMIRQNVWRDVSFEKKDGQDHSFEFYDGYNGIEVSWKGRLRFKNEEYLDWDFSIQNGVFLEGRFGLDQEKKDITTKIYNFYADWKKNWLDYMSKGGKDSGSANINESRSKENIIKNSGWRMSKLAGLK